MYNVIIVDDEEIIRSGIAMYLRTAFSNINIVSVLDDGSKAIDFLYHTDVDIVLSDIMMATKSGIELAKYIYNFKPYIKVIFLSGYKEFEYAKQAMDYNVMHYLSKPIDLDELVQAINSTIITIDEENQQRLMLARNLQQYNKLFSFVVTNFFSDILLGVLNDGAKIKERAAAIGLSSEYLAKKCCIFSLSMLNSEIWRYSKDDFFTTITNLLRDINNIDEYILILKNENEYNYTFALVSSCFSDSLEFENHLNKSFVYLAASVRSMLGIKIEINIDFISKDILSLYEYNSGSFHKLNDAKLLDSKFKELVSMIIAKNKKSAFEIFDTIKGYIDNLSFEESKQFSSFFISTIIKETRDKITLPNDILNNKFVDNITSKNELFAWLDHIITMLFNGANNYSDITLYTIAKAKDYIKSNYMKDITLDDVANYVYLNPVYFSRFFKLNTGVNLSDYIINVRMMKAIELFKTHKYKIYEISTMCGYKSSKYFAKTFKRYMGYTPTEYLRTISNGGEY